MYLVSRDSGSLRRDNVSCKMSDGTACSTALRKLLGIEFQNAD